VRKLVVASTILLALTGVALVFVHWPGAPPGARKAAALVHIWLGVAYLVVFPLYAWDHIRKNRRWLAALRSVTASGWLQLLCAAVAIVTGIVLLAYGGAALGGMRAWHHGATYPLLAALLWHYLSPKTWREPAAAPPRPATQGCPSPVERGPVAQATARPGRGSTSPLPTGEGTGERSTGLNAPRASARRGER